MSFHIKNHHNIKDISENKTVTVLDENTITIPPYNCEICSKSFSSALALSSHQKAKKHGKYSNIEYIKSNHSKHKEIPINIETKDYKKKVQNSILIEQIKRKKDKDFKTALHEKSAINIDNTPYYNVEAYKLAIRIMTASEAYKLAKDEIKSLDIIKKNKYSKVEIIIPQKCADVLAQAKFKSCIVNTRVNQYDFSRRVSHNFNHTCSITGSKEALEAAHIDPVGTKNNNTSNGILMLACLHRLFDTGYLAINPESLTIHFSKKCTYFAKDILEGKTLAFHHTSLNKDGLKKTWQSFMNNEKTNSNIEK